MKIYSWNVLFKNRKIKEAEEFIKELDFDVLCLQEVTLELLEAVKKLNFEMSYTTDARNAIGMHLYNVILSRLPILHSEDFEIVLPRPVSRTTLVIKAMRWYGWSPLLEKRALYIDVQAKGRMIRIASFHATLFGPMNRFLELECVFRKMDDKPHVIAGDFNSIEAPHLKILNWLLGSPFEQGLPWYSERKRAEKVFQKHGLQNALSGKVTHRFSHSQLDHILVSKDIKITKAWVEKDSHGSDHQPIGVEIEL